MGSNARFCKSGHGAGTPEVVHPESVVFIFEPISIFSSGRFRAFKIAFLVKKSPTVGRRLRPIQQIRRPRRRCTEQIVVLAERESCHLVEERLLARMHVRRIGAAEAEAAVFYFARPKLRFFSHSLVFG